MPQRKALDTHTLILELGLAMKSILRLGLPLSALVVAVMTGLLAYKGYPGVAGFAYISVGLCFCLLMWRANGIGLPLVPVLALQHFIVYGLPIYNGNDTILDYPRVLVDHAGWETCVFLVTLGAAWYAGMQMMRPSRGMAYTITSFNRSGIAALRKVGVALIVGTSAFSVLDFLGVTDFVFQLLPSGTWSIVTASISAAAMAGFFLVSMMVGTGEASASLKVIFALSLVVSFGIMLTSLLLYTVLGLVGAVCLGFVWSAGRVPWKFLVSVVALVGFLQIGKTEMRDRYHFSGDDDSSGVTRPTTLAGLPNFYGDWFRISLGDLVDSGKTGTQDERAKHASLGDRVDNLQNLLYVMKAVEIDKVSPLGGGTYWIIPALLTPRIVWPEKPRTHEGQVMLNVYYGRQTNEESFGTYIAWGLLPEAYGNFGPLLGAVFLGVVLGIFFAWVEGYTAYKPLLSLEGMCAFALLLGVATSFEMVASVLVTSQFQSAVVTCLACAPFVTRLPVLDRPEEAEA